MLQNHITVRLRHERFIKIVSETKIVYGLSNDEGFASSSSTTFDNDNDEPIGLVCFWSDKARARSCINSAWENYQIVELSLQEFLENWCVGLHNDNLMVGTNFDSNMFGFEAEPLELILDIIGELKTRNIKLELTKYESIDDLARQIKEILDLK